MTAIQDALSKLQQYSSTTQEDNTVRLLNALLEHAPTPEGRRNVAIEIASCGDDAGLRQLKERYAFGLLAPMRANGGKTPPVSSHPSRPSAVVNESELEVLVETAKRDKAVLRDLCLRRDGFRCVISGIVDWRSWRNRVPECPDNDPTGDAVAAHIIPFSIATKSDTAAAVQRSSAIFEILNRFGGIRLQELNGSQINRLENVFTLHADVHLPFGALDVWLEEIEGREDTYVLRHSVDRVCQVPAGKIITLQSAVAGIPLPDPRYIAIHAACAKVLHASGAAEVIDQYLKDYEELKVLSNDDSSSRLLANALSLISVA